MTTRDTRRAIGLRIKSLREDAGLSKTTLSQLAGMSRPYLSRIEAGSANATVDALAEIADALGLSLAALIDGESLRHGREATAPTPRRVRQITDEDVLERIRRAPGTTVAMIAHSLGVSSSVVDRSIARLKVEGRLSRVGPPRGGRWVVADDGGGHDGG